MHTQLDSYMQAAIDNYGKPCKLLSNPTPKKSLAGYLFHSADFTHNFTVARNRNLQINGRNLEKNLPINILLVYRCRNIAIMHLNRAFFLTSN